jgi:hypothetical protein
VLQKVTHAISALSSIDPARFLHEHLASASPDLLRSMVTTFVNTLVLVAPSHHGALPEFDHAASPITPRG